MKDGEFIIDDFFEDLKKYLKNAEKMPKKKYGNTELKLRKNEEC